MKEGDRDIVDFPTKTVVNYGANTHKSGTTIVNARASVIEFPYPKDRIPIVEVSMKSFSKHFSLIVFSMALTLGLASLTFGQDKDKEWRPITPDELSSQKALVEPDADAEAIFWETRIDDSSETDLTQRHYVRIKIHTERGREKYSKFDIPFTKDSQIKDLMARITKPDGTSVEIKKEDVFEREIIKTSGVKVKAKSFAVPNIEPGIILEYKYKQVFKYASAMGMYLEFQRDVPIQRLAYFYKPYGSNRPNYRTYNFTDTKFVKDKDGYWLASRTNIPAIKEEPRMPPEDTFRAWMLLTGARLTVLGDSAFSITYTVKDPGASSYWGAVALDNAGLTQFIHKTGGDIKKVAAEVTAGAATDEEKLKKLYTFCQTQIANTTFDPSITDEQREKLPQLKSLSDVLKKKSASSPLIDMLFGSLATAAGFETRVVFSGDRSKLFFTPDMRDERLIHPAAIAVKLGTEWRYFNPGMKFAPYGMLAWYEEDTFAMLIGEKTFDWKKIPQTDHSTSVTKRKGKFNLLEDGTLEGTVQLELNGQPALAYRIDNYDEAPARLEANFTDDIKRRISAAEISNVAIENLTDSSKPLVKKYTVRVPNYAQKTGKRMFLQPGFFEYGESPVFSSSTRKYDLFFQYPWSEEDRVEITYPKNFDLDNADAPGQVADKRNIGSLNIKIGVTRDNNLLVYDRKFHFGGGGNVLFDAAMYQPLKGMFDSFHTADAHTLTLKQQ